MKEDKLVQFYSEALTFYEDYQSKIFIGVGVVAVLIVAFILYSNKMEEDNRLATTEMSRVIPLYDAGSYQEAIDGKPGTKVLGFKKIIDEYGSTEQGQIAKIYMANSYYFLQNYDEALKYYDDYSGSLDLFKATSIAGKAACYEAKGNLEEAADYFKEAAFVTETNPQNAQYLLDASRNFIKTGDSEEAKFLLEKIQKDYSGTPAAKEVDRYLAQL